VTHSTSRASGILLHPTSLPGRFGIGDLGPSAHAFVEFLSAAGQAVWQVLPLVPTGYGDSPYQGLGAMAGNPLLISPELLLEEGLLLDAELGTPPPGGERVDYGAVIEWKTALLRLVAERFDVRASAARRRELAAFRDEHAWLNDFCLFAALKDAHGGVEWSRWAPAFAAREAAALERARRDLRGELRAHALAQFLFAAQWAELRRRCAAQRVRLVGDLPIYPALDSAEVWARRELFELDERGAPTLVAGVPPDYFSATGQLWGNPVYRWDQRPSECHSFFAERARAVLSQVDLVRLDHFRGFEAFWAIPAGAPTAASGDWRRGPGRELFEALRAALGGLPFIAENLGVITPEVEALRQGLGLPGMAVLQFAFGTDAQARTFQPHAYDRDVVAYTGTHDNDTTLGWWSSEGGDSTRSADDVRREKDFARRYLGTEGMEMNWVLIRALFASVADLTVAPLQDVLGLGSEARMNRPATASGNWRWRFREGALGPALADRLAELSALYERTPNAAWAPAATRPRSA
jgi:4-alpha-glucanotransferase